MSLSLGVNSQEVSYEHLKEFRITDRNHTWVGKGGKTYNISRSDQWEGLQHHDFASRIVNTCAGFNMPVNMTQSRWGVSNEGSDLFASVSFLDSYMGKETALAKYFTTDTMPCLGLRHSNRGRFSSQMTIGASAFVCDNLIITGEFLFRKKHTSNNAAELDVTIRQGLMKFLAEQNGIVDMIDNLKRITMNEYHVPRMYLNMARSNVLPWSHIGKVDKYWQEPTHSEFAQHGDSGWRMYNAINTVAKEYNPVRQIEVITKAEGLIKEATRYNSLKGSQHVTNY